MASKTKRKAAPLGLIFGGVAVIALGAGLVWQLREGAAAKADQARADADIPVLPTGALRLLGTSVKEARFLLQDGAARTGPMAEGLVLIVAKSPTEFEGAAMMSQRKRFDCVQHRVFDGAAGYFRVDGVLMTRRSFYNGKRGRPTSASEIEEAALCGPPQQAGRLFDGFQAAQRDIQTPPDDIEALAKARPDDPHVFAWLCAVGARGRWRKETPADCDRAVKLNPAAAEPRLDRAVLNYKIGRQAAGEAELKALVATAPDNAAALFVLGLMKETRGDKAGGRRDRSRALQLDPGVPDWLQVRYDLTIGQAFRTV
jgi:hypothetical protein